MQRPDLTEADRRKILKLKEERLSYSVIASRMGLKSKSSVRDVVRQAETAKEATA